MKRQNIENPDLDQMTDEEIFLESQYIGERVAMLTDQIRQRSGLILSGWTQTTKSLTSRHLVGDLGILLDRQQAIIEEIDFRATSMR